MKIEFIKDDDGELVGVKLDDGAGDVAFTKEEMLALTKRFLMEGMGYSIFTMPHGDFMKWFFTTKDEDEVVKEG